MATFDELELRLVLALLEDPRAQIGDLSTTLGVARNTVQSRLKRLDRTGVLRHGGREVDLAALGFDVLAFITIEVSHRELDSVIAALRTQEQVLEVHEISGRGDVWCRVVARDTHHLQSLLRSILRMRGVIRTETSLALSEHIPYRAEPLLRHLAGPGRH
ncbi:MAG: Lrp/AsnC family transcriptional regulator [Arthrobacter sp.]|uniref:Lrp/AsnC family transcriptional regulator n=1 Tax=unclassified Arthrobacter TaxID=235627 RepID=UPI00264CEDDB|nr:Lrp/AsnC family transcriptional regulator [Micrococcaceae bacterium]MDN5811647.1 Lrp/AsnC family transcriptional regulator [Micrococcaceae bacterium]MDN5823739.1 Lrp/AsnC family transcriptional regulator [Micrococcaceae bacterium]MDN5879583.1 Lrp/AsnC family transcriptional regulator [Micrococcaceae bacterium]MDN5886896.1 Lrp/AsnC family transcriptional regulator [Micrococcaceae bacterium]